MSTNSPSTVLLGTGRCVPENRVTNDDMAKFVDTNHEWIYSRTGIEERRIATQDEATSDFATAAARNALEDAGIDATEIDLIVCGTCTPDKAFPSVSCIVQDAIGATNAWAFDLNAACTGFLYSLETARRLIESGAARTALVLGAETTSTLVDFEDRTTCVLFGDGAGAVVIQAGEGGGVIDSLMGSDGSLAHLLHVSGGGSRQLTEEEQAAQSSPKAIKMIGKDVFKHAVTRMVETCKELMERNGLGVDDIALVVPHQANVRIIQGVQQRVGMPEEKIYVNVSKYGNTSAASVPVALDEAARLGRIKEGDVVLMVAFGAGFTWGATLVKWTKSS